ncbi:hypothetical protein CRG98_021045 [Punica granatum]|uniref:Uncharacterized protein n=1 Tax=Punica granatum TaxID=22663 RepID=A0A2I0JQM3_PUNGR|nr:hypothetical protein CRG98_021045 [Punica granatum]
MGSSLIQRATHGCRAWGTLNFGSPIIATLERLDCDWGPHSCTFPGCGLACATVLGKARGAGSQEDRRVEQRRVGWAHSSIGSVIVLEAPWRMGWDMLCSLELSPVIFRDGRRRANAPEVCAWVRWRHARTTRKDALGCVGGCAQLREETCALDHAMTLGCAGLVRR